VFKIEGNVSRLRARSSHFVGHLPDGSYGEVVAWNVVPGSSVMYNLEVNQDHTFTVGDGHWIVHNSDCGWIKELPKDPQQLIEQGWQDITDPRAKASPTNNGMDLEDPETGRHVRFDRGQPGETGWKGSDHYHVYNPDASGKSDRYLDINGDPVRKGAPASHIAPWDN
jgi:hypothetical protein